MRKIFAGIVCCLILFITVVPCVHAQTDCTNNAAGSGSNYNYQSGENNCPPTFDEIGNVIIALISAILAIAVVIFFFMIVVNGFNFITAGGNPERLEAARKGVVFTVIGFGLVFGSFIILNIIKNVTGVSGGFSIGANGNIEFNIESTYVPTPPANQY